MDTNQLDELLIKIALTISDYKEIDELNKKFADKKIDQEVWSKCVRYNIRSVNDRWNN